jgi:2-amino-4-hydroxy-6-hydroxymethyldihydropteridine diphosphokinase
VTTPYAEFLIALGANLPSDLGPPAVTLRAALDALGDAGAQVHAVSRFYHTPCFPAGAGPDYVNAAARIGFAGDARGLLDLLHAVEAEFGRARVTRWGQRVLDLDLIASGQTILPDEATLRAWIDLPLKEQTQSAPETLLLPHPRVQDRAFVLVPLMDIAPDWRHPLLGLTVAQMCAALPEEDCATVRALDEGGQGA